MENTNIYIDEHGVQYSSAKLILKHLPNGIRQYIVMDGCKSIEITAFRDNEELEELTLPKSVILLPKDIY